jgi:nucleoside-diphosphate-sugar epimerase
MWRTNVDGTRAVVEACAKQPNPPSLVLVSSLAAVGPSRDGRPVDEESKPHPHSGYGKSKLEAERIVRERHQVVPVSIVRPPVVLGEGDLEGLQLFRAIAKLRLHLVPTFRRYRLSLIHADDLARALDSVSLRGERVTDRGPAAGSYFVACGQTPTYAEFGEMIARAIGVRRFAVLPVATPMLKLTAGVNELFGRVTGSPQLVNWDKSRDAVTGPWICSAEKIRTQLGFTLSKSLQDRLDQTARWYAEHGYLRLGHGAPAAISQAGRD